MFVVTMEGVYIQEVFGPWTVEQYAYEWARRLATEPGEDGYHRYIVRHLTTEGLGEPLHEVQEDREHAAVRNHKTADAAARRRHLT